MQNSHNKSERKLIRKLADVAWSRQLRNALKDIGNVISQMDAGNLSPFEANEAVHQFHNGISRDLYKLYALNDPWWAVCRAHYDGVLTDEDFAEASDNIRDELKQFADRVRQFKAMRAEPAPEEPLDDQ